MSAPNLDAAPVKVVIDGLQYCNWSRTVLEQMREGGVAAVHATVAYHETFRETVGRIVAWNRRFAAHGDLIRPGRSAGDVEWAAASGRTAIFFGAQNPSPLDGDLGLIEVLHALGLRFMQLTYNNQSLLGSGWQEPEDGGVTRMGREAIAEMNRVGMAIDLSHAGERTALETIALSQRPVAATHANPQSWQPTRRNLSDRVIDALAEAGGIVGLSLYPNHLKDGSACTLESFCAMATGLAERIGPQRIAIGSDLCQDQPGSVLRWMRAGRWTFEGEGEEAGLAFPPQPEFFRDNRDFRTLRRGLAAAGFAAAEVDGILGGNWLAFMRDAFVPAASA